MIIRFTWEVIVGLAALFGHVQLVRIQILFFQKVHTIMSKVLIEPVNGPNDQVTTVQVLLDFNLQSQMVTIQI